MKNAIDKFRLNKKSVEELDYLHSMLSENFPLLKEQSDEILRAEIVMIVSALDCYLHDIFKVQMIEIFKGNKPPNKIYEKYQIRTKLLSDILNSQNEADKIGYFENEIKEMSSKDSYQSPLIIESILSFVEIKHVWKRLSKEMSIPSDDIKNTIALIVYRRNKISHEADYNSVTLSKNPIDKNTVSENIKFISCLCESINKLIK